MAALAGLIPEGGIRTPLRRRLDQHREVHLARVEGIRVFGVDAEHQLELVVLRHVCRGRLDPQFGPARRRRQEARKGHGDPKHPSRESVHGGTGIRRLKTARRGQPRTVRSRPGHRRGIDLTAFSITD